MSSTSTQSALIRAAQAAPATMAFDMATVGFALETLRVALGTSDIWHSLDSDTQATGLQELLLDWVEDNKDGIIASGSKQMNALASTSHLPLNAFMAEHGLESMFEPFEDGVGVATVLDLLVEWLEQGEDAVVTAKNGTPYHGFTLCDNVRMYRVGLENGVHDDVWCEDPLIEVVTQNGISLWLMVTGVPLGATQLAPFASQILRCAKSFTTDFGSTVTLPCLDINQAATLDWLLGLHIDVPSPQTVTPGRYRIQQAFQQLKLRMNRDGAHAKVGTGTVATRECSLPYGQIINRPFLGFFTLKPDADRPGIETVPLAPFYASFDTWNKL